jgi:hypothetical protein
VQGTSFLFALFRKQGPRADWYLLFTKDVRRVAIAAEQLLVVVFRASL